MNDPNKSSDDGWDSGWEEHKTRQLRRMAKLPLIKKLEWLEEAAELVGFIRQSAGGDRKTPGSPV